MQFWIMVAVAYAIIIAVGLSIGMELSKRYPRRGGGHEVPVTPVPIGPSFGVEWGTDFDRMLLPDAFPASERTSK